jgi:hypothetical protein
MNGSGERVPIGVFQVELWNIRSIPEISDERQRLVILRPARRPRTKAAKDTSGEMDKRSIVLKGNIHSLHKVLDRLDDVLIAYWVSKRSRIDF